ncbi:hypothetical protein [Yersinia similis]|uniref:Uncharacterized protein n=1 Tax=Yersinia similis TaxID=367190 RepID=A0A0T9QMA0_9GAMM|nr:hypothetical protein [Yersinia similis]CNB11841.1 Uncharacterised protein [Yersinia similis]CNF14626.1 Uncharacterised protein [Yersinia similis]CNI18573.1 Uncharacterised protein [Yersinia similis]
MADYLKYYMQRRMEASRNLALHVDKTAAALGDVAENTINSIQMGVKRTIWRSSYFFDGYKDVYENINSEDYRMGLAVVKAIKERDIVMFMTRIYVEYLLQNFDENKQKEIFDKLLKGSAKFATSKATKLSISYAIATTLSECLYLNPKIRMKIRSYSNVSMLGFQFYGYIEKASIAASGLKRDNPAYYSLLYSQDIEMLYFILSPVLSHVIHNKNINKTSEDIIRIINEIAYN